MFKFVALSFVAAGTLFASSAFAAAPPANTANAVTPAGAAAAAAVRIVAPKFDCSVKPVAPPKAGDLFQMTGYTITWTTGTLPKDGKKIAVRLGIQATGGVQTTFCSNGFARGKTQTASSVAVVPPVMDANYIWLCNALITNDACDPVTAPAVPN